jgi:RNA polymerase sigma-70 factor (ECF subfamily)
MAGEKAESMDDRSLVEQSAQGNPKAFKILVLRYQRMVFFYLKNFTFPEQVREDLAQETFLRAYRNIDRFDPDKGAGFSTWLVTIARNLALNERAKAALRKEQSGGLRDEEHGRIEKGPQEILEQRRLKSRVREAIGRLPERFHTAVVLSYFDELSLEEIARIESCPVGTIKSRVFRGKRILREILEGENAL